MVRAWNEKKGVSQQVGENLESGVREGRENRMKEPQREGVHAQWCHMGRSDPLPIPLSPGYRHADEGSSYTFYLLRIFICCLSKELLEAMMSSRVVCRNELGRQRSASQILFAVY